MHNAGIQKIYFTTVQYLDKSISVKILNKVSFSCSKINKYPLGYHPLFENTDCTSIIHWERKPGLCFISGSLSMRPLNRVILLACSSILSQGLPCSQEMPSQHTHQEGRSLLSPGRPGPSSPHGHDGWSQDPKHGVWPTGCCKFLELSMEHQWTLALSQLSDHLVFLYLCSCWGKCKSLIPMIFKNERIN